MNKRQYKKLYLKPCQQWLVEYAKFMEILCEPDNFKAIKREIERIVMRDIISTRPYVSKLAQLPKPMPDYVEAINKVTEQMNGQRQTTLRPYWVTPIDLKFTPKN